MKRRNFIELLTVTSSAAVVSPAFANSSLKISPTDVNNAKAVLSADVVIAGGGLGGCAAALAALRNNLTVILTEQTDWIGGQLTQQGVPPDEHPWIETHGATQLYRNFRKGVRDYYINNYPLTDESKSKEFFNPGDAPVSALCHEPRVALAVLQSMMDPYLSSKNLTILLEHQVTRAQVAGDEVKALEAVDLVTGEQLILKAPFFVDATELGDLLPMTGTEFITGAESKVQTKELHAPVKPDPNNVQSFNMPFAMDYVPGGNFVIPKPKEYDYWRNLVPKLTPKWSGKLLDLAYSKPATLVRKELAFDPTGPNAGDTLNLWHYRRIISKSNFKPGTYAGDITVVNWPQNDYFEGNLIGATPEQFVHHVNRAKQLSLSLLYWLQTEAPRPDGGHGWPGLRLRADVMGTRDGLSKYPYIRESRRIKAVFTILEEHVGQDNRAQITGKNTGNTSADFYDSVGIGYYHIDLHPSTAGNNYIDFESMPFQIPLGALLPRRMKNLLPANKNIGTTHITNGCYRLHPVEWSIGEAVGMLITYAMSKKVIPRAVREQPGMLQEFQEFIHSQGIETKWPA
ncbi:FAD-dependent oxidoreductase [Mucilaginibacter sp. PAMB04168]|uniref:FAD-dependent oxidoreductase n=1 Tax=Mucilaginibacter sp. PAMB04168 TaxID=3138567 RepID=UPI0031F634BF